MMIIDTFTFYNELDLLEVRLTELWDVVDHFVLVEATVSFTGHPKPLHYANNRARFEKFQSKIRHIIVEDMPMETDNWSREHWQRNSISKGLCDCRDDDVVMISDIDEIPAAEAITRCRNLLTPYVMQQGMYYYYLNFRGGQWNGTTCWRFKDLALRTVQELRDCRESLPVITGGGWHFSFLGGVPAIQEKIYNYSHQEYNKPRILNEKNIQYSMITGRDLFGRRLMFSQVDVDELPCLVRAQPDKFRHLMVEIKGGEPRFTENWYPEYQSRSLNKLARRVRHLHGAVVEIGSWEGRSAITLANASYPTEVFAVDTWGGNVGESPDHPSVVAATERDVFMQFAVNINHMTRKNVFPFVMTSSEFLSCFKAPVKLCHIDACHDYHNVKRDIQGVLRYVVPGGILCGDDFANAHARRADLQGGVERAVRELLPGFRTKRNFWYWQKPCGWDLKTRVRRLAAGLPDFIVNSGFGQALLPPARSVTAQDVLLQME